MRKEYLTGDQEPPTPRSTQNALTWDPREHDLNNLYGEVVMRDPQQQAAEGGNALRGMHGAGQQSAAGDNTDDGSRGNAQSAIEESDTAMSLDEPLTCMEAAFRNVKRGRESADAVALTIAAVDAR